ncbi:MAG: hypothetical protein HY860_00390 [Chlamydiales bacterium]|nr:hypothetical protein [Chlamydiales bacterium]
MRKHVLNIIAYLLFITINSICIGATDTMSNATNTQPNLIHISGGEDAEGYTINFQNVSMLEFMKFISKIANINFIYNPGDLNFDINVLSDDPTSLENVMATFIQVLKINGFNLIEDGNNFVINRNAEIKQIPTIVSEEEPYIGKHFPAYVTRVFHLNNANPAQIAQLLRPMISSTAMIDVIPSSRLLIITDMTSNINQISKLLSILDQPQSALQVGSYIVKTNNTENLKILAEQIIIPVVGDTPIIFVAQPSTNVLYVISTPYYINLAMTLLTEIDSAPMNEQQKVLTGNNIFIYKLQYRSADFVENSLKNIGANAESLGFLSNGLYETIANVKYLKLTNSLLFIGPEDVLDRIKQLLAQIDVPGKPTTGNEHAYFYMFHPSHTTPNQLKIILLEIATSMDESGLSDQALIFTIQNAKIIDATQSILFTGDNSSIEEIKKLLIQVDQETANFKINASSFYIYKLKNATDDQMEKALHSFAANLQSSQNPDESLINAINSMKWVPDTNSLIFTGTEKAIVQLQNIVPSFDVQPLEVQAQLMQQRNAKSAFFMYTPKNVTPETLEASIEDVAQKLSQSGLADPSFITTLETAKYIPSSKTVLFTGTPSSIDRVQTLLSILDQTKEGSKVEEQIFIYTPKYANVDTIQDALSNFANSLPTSDTTRRVVQNAKWLDNSRSFIFQGSTASIDKIKQILAVTDVDNLSKENKTYFIYKLKYIPGDVVIKDLQQMIRTLQLDPTQKDSLTNTVSNIEWIKSTNSLFITGTKNDVDEIKNLIAEFDVGGQTQELEPTTFMIYKPLYISPEQAEIDLQAIASDLEDSGLSDVSLISTINSVKISQSGSALVFTGTQTNLDKVKTLLSTIDVSAGQEGKIQQVGMSSFFIYKIKYVSADFLTGHLNSIASQMQEIKGADKDFISAITNMRYVKDTNSIIFVGSAAALEQIRTLLDKFDVLQEGQPQPEITPRAPGGYTIYKPKYVPGPDLINILKDFEQNLKTSGVVQQNLFDVIDHLKWMEKTDSILISGTESDTIAVKDLLEKFDIPQKGAPKPANIGTFEDLSFLMYKLQYHQGDEIQTALKQIATDLKKGKDSVEAENLMNAIQSLQWIKVTNSLISSGEPRTLAKLKELLYSIDIPLTQVYIEVLVLQTTLGKLLDFGLQWASQGKYKNRFAYGFGNFPPAGTDPTNGTFGNNVSKISGTNVPTGSNIPFITGGDLGVIGDIILHKGTTYFSLGSLISAVEQDSDATIVLNQKIVAQDNNNAQLFVGSNIPFSGSTVQIIGQTQTTSSNLEYRDIGTSLSITPTIGDNDVVTLDIDLELSSTTNSGANTSSTSSVLPSNLLSASTTEKTTIQTKLLVPDNHFVVLTGMINDSTIHDRAGIPCLGGLPVIGVAFSQNNSTKVKQNVIMFLKPTIIKSSDIFKHITDRQEQLFREQADMEAYDAGINLVSTPDDK